jgi:monoamine oxidase
VLNSPMCLQCDYSASNGLNLEHLKRAGPQAHQIIHYVDQDWYNEPWTKTYIGVMPPQVMSRFGSVLREPVGRIHWAGTERAAVWNGCMEGAILSGERAAQEVLARLLANNSSM